MPSKHFQNTLRELIKKRAPDFDGPKLSDDLFDKAVDNLVEGASQLKKKIKLISVDDVQIQVLYNPQFVTLSSKEDGGEFGSIGNIYAFMSRESDGETFSVSINKDFSEEMFDSMDSEKLLGLIKKQVGATEYLSGEPVNNILGKNVFDNTRRTFRKPSYEEMTNIAQSKNILSFPYNHDSDVFDRNGNPPQLVFSNEKERYSFQSSTRISASRWMDYRVLSHFGLQTDDVDVLAEIIQEDFEHQYVCLTLAQSSARNELLPYEMMVGRDQIRVNIGSNGLQAQVQLYPENLLNFVASGDSKEVRQNRANFIERSYELLLGDVDERLNAPDILKRKVDNYVSSMISSKSVSKYGLDIVPEKLLNAIDEGKEHYPFKEIASHYGFESVSKKQCRSAFANARDILASKHSSHWFGVDMSNLGNVLALEKLPKEWLKFSANEDVPPLDLPQKMVRDRDALGVMDKISHSLIDAAKKRDRMESQKDKVGLAQSTSKWSWLSNQKEPLATKLNKINEDYKVNASYGDYPKMIDNFAEAIMLRAIYSHPDINVPSAAVFDEDSLEVNIDYDEVSQVFRERLIEEQGYELDEDEVYMYDDFEFTSIDEYSIRNAISAGSDNMKDRFVKNQKIHNMYSSFIKEANKASTDNFSWTGVMDNDVSYGGLDFHPISDKQDLLMEGDVQRHCVFSYLNQCLEGSASIVSVRLPGEDVAVATLELDMMGEDDDGNLQFEIVQCLGFKNERVDDRTTAIIDAWLEDVNSGQYPVNDFSEQDLSDEPIMALVESDPLTYGHVVKSIPYHTDAAYLAYFELEALLPNNMTVSDVMGEGEFNSMIFNGSDFSKEIKQIEALSNELGRTPKDLVRVKMSQSIENISDIPNALNGISSKRDVLMRVMDEVGGQYEPFQLASYANLEMDKALGEVYPLDALTSLFESNGDIDMFVYEHQTQEAPESNYQYEALTTQEPERVSYGMRM